MYSIISQGGVKQAHVTEFIVDTEVEVANLPKAPDIAVGSTCICTDSGKVYILAADNSWKVFA